MKEEMGSESDLRLICFSVGFKRSSHTCGHQGTALLSLQCLKDGYLIFISSYKNDSFSTNVHVCSSCEKRDHFTGNIKDSFSKT